MAVPPWLKTIGSIGLQVAAATIPGVAAIEAIAAALPGLKGPQKQQAVVDLVKNALMASEGITQKDLLNDTEVEAATRSVIDAIVHLDNVIKQK